MDDNRLQYHTNASNQLQLFGNPSEGSIDLVNYSGNDHLNNPIIHLNKRGRESGDIQRQQKLQISLNYNNIVCKDEVDRLVNIPKQSLVSTGLRLSYDDDEQNSALTSASGSNSVAPFLSLGDNIRTVLGRQKEEFDQCMNIQAENLANGIRDMKQKHTASFITIRENKTDCCRSPKLALPSEIQ